MSYNQLHPFKDYCNTSVFRLFQTIMYKIFETNVRICIVKRMFSSITGPLPTNQGCKTCPVTCNDYLFIVRWCCNTYIPISCQKHWFWGPLSIIDVLQLLVSIYFVHDCLKMAFWLCHCEHYLPYKNVMLRNVNFSFIRRYVTRYIPMRLSAC